MKLRITVLLLIVIVLVSLNWFKVLMAQDMGWLDEEEKRQLLEKYRKQQALGPESYYYQSPEIFGEGKQSDKSVVEKGKPVDDGQAKPALIGGMPDFEQLRPFGTELFAAPQEIEPPSDIASAADYVLGPGDNIVIYLWGRVEREYNLTLDREGKVFIPRVGEVIGWGLTLEQFTQKTKKQFSRVYSEFDLTISLGKVRSIRIYVTGEVEKPGAYTVSSLTSLFNAIYIAGGPNGRGSMRNIKLMRSGKPKELVDLYNLLLAGDNSTDVRLQTGDVVFVPVAGARVAIRGEINRSALYELKGGETVLELLTLAGNPTPQAHLDRVMLERISDNGDWEVLDLNLNAEKSDSIDNVTLMDGDRLTVFSIFDFKKNMIAIFGRVKHPGYYERNDSTCVSDLVRQGQLQPYDVYYGRADLFRRYPDRRIEVIPIDLEGILTGAGNDNILLQDHDSLRIYSIDEVERDKFVYIEGEVKSPGRYPLYDSMTVEDLIFLSGSFSRGASRHQAEIARLDSLGDVSLLYVGLDDSSYKQVYLCEDDHLYIRQIPEWQLDRSVTIEGEVNYPGRYTLSNREETLYQLLQRAGGFTRNAFPKGIIFQRGSIERQLARLNVPEVLQKSRPLVADTLGYLVQRDVFQYDFQQMSRVIIDIDKIMSTEGSEGNIVLEPGDQIYVPSVPSGISVMGAVGANGTIKFAKNKNVKYYIKRAGNFTRQSDKGEVRLMRAGGEVISGGGTLGKKVALGDVIIVPAKIEKERNWLKTVTTALTTTTGILTSVYIVSKL
jgi:protein involved in polysaccharide export with SLBB domain